MGEQIIFVCTELNAWISKVWFLFVQSQNECGWVFSGAKISHCSEFAFQTEATSIPESGQLSLCFSL